jgi:GrpB-like predicted nucleotidyltransferase (UPF0157 family)
MLGLEGGVLRLVPCCDEWPRLYEQEARLIRQAIAQHVRDIQHIGSTAIPGMVAKPIIDIAVGVDSLDAAEICIQPLEGIGYEYRWRTDDPPSHYFVKGNPREYHLRVFDVGLPDWARHIGFRDRLRENQGLAQAYAEVKTRLCERFPRDREAYQEGKAPFIRRILAHTEAEPAAPPDAS